MNGYVIHQIHKYYNLDHYEDFVIGLVDSSESNVDVTRLINIAKAENIASLATIHNALKRCLDKGFITLKSSEADRRKKILKLTQKSRKYLDELRNDFNTYDERVGK